MNGTPLSKGHGRLGDLDKIIKEMQNYHDDCAKTSEYTRLGFETAIAGAYIHGRAGDVAAKEIGKHSVVASDIATSLPEVLR